MTPTKSRTLKRIAFVSAFLTLAVLSIASVKFAFALVAIALAGLFIMILWMVSGGIFSK